MEKKRRFPRPRERPGLWLILTLVIVIVSAQALGWEMKIAAGFVYQNSETAGKRRHRGIQTNGA